VILLVGDQPISRYALAKILRKEGYEVTEAASTNEALELLQELLFQKLPIDLVITDGTGGMVWTRGCPDHRRRVGGPARELKTVLLRLIGFTDIERKEPPSKKPPIKPPTRRKKPPIKEPPDPPNPDDQAPIGDPPPKRGPKRVLVDGSLPTPQLPAL
jgi:hypothetical protein